MNATRNLLPLVMAGFARYRKKRRNLTVVLSLVFFLLFVFMNVFTVLDRNLESYWVESFSCGDLVVPAAERRVDLMGPVNPERYFEAGLFMADNPALSGRSSPRLRFGALIGPQQGEAELETGLVLIGIDPDAEARIMPELTLSDGRRFSADAAEIILPQSIAGSIGVEVGGAVVMAVMTADGYYNMESATLVGIQDVPATSFVFGTYMGYIPIALAQRLMNTTKVSEIAIGRDGPGAFTVVRGPFRLSPALRNHAVSKAISMAYRFLRVIIIAFLGVFSIGIVYQNVMTMNEDRLPEIGVYLSYGARPGWIHALMWLELAVYVTFCAMIGGIAGALTMGALTVAGLAPVDMVTDVMMGARPLELWPSPLVWLSAWALLMACVLTASALPVIRATRDRAIVRLFKR